MTNDENSDLIFFSCCTCSTNASGSLAKRNERSKCAGNKTLISHLFQIHGSLCHHVIGRNIHPKSLSQRIRRCGRIQRCKIPAPGASKSCVLVQAACANVMKLIRSSNDLSRSSDHDFLMSFAPLRRRMDTIAEKILQRYNSVDCEPID